MSSSFINFIKSIIEVTIEQEEKLYDLLSFENIKKDENFISEGQLPKTIAFVTKGLFRYYYANEKGEEFTKNFFPENSVLSSYSAIIDQRASYFTIQALEDSEIEVVDYERLTGLFQDYEGWNKVLLTLVQKGFIIKEAREREFLLFDAEERYKSFLNSFPGLDKRVTQHVIASYLRITPESLSRLRRKMGLLT